MAATAFAKLYKVLFKLFARRSKTDMALVGTYAFAAEVKGRATVLASLEGVPPDGERGRLDGANAHGENGEDVNELHIGG